MSKLFYVAVNILACLFVSFVAFVIHPFAGVGVAALSFLYLMWAVIPLSGGMSFSEKRKLEKYRKTTTREDRLVISHAETNYATAVSRNGDVVSMFLELSPSPLQSVAYTDDGTGIPDVPLGIIAESMRKFDITVDSIEVVSHGSVTADDSPYSRAYRPSLKNNMTRWRTYIEVSVRLSKSIPAVRSRCDKGEGPEVGISRVTTVATTRLRNLLIDAGWHVRLLTKADVKAIDDEFSVRLDGVFDHEKRTYMGSGNRWAAAYACTSPHIRPSKIRTDALAMGVVRRLVPVGARGVSVETFLILEGEDRESVALKNKRVKKLSGVQGDIVSHMLPLAPNPPITVPRPIFSVSNFSRLPENVGPAWGIGALLGEAIGTHRRVSLTTSSAKNEVLYVSASKSFIRNILARMAASGERIIVEAEGDDWTHWISTMNTPRITRSRGKADVVIVEREGEVPPRAGVLVIVVCVLAPPSARFAVQQMEDGTFKAISGNTYRDFQWTASKAERAWWS